MNRAVTLAGILFFASALTVPAGAAGATGGGAAAPSAASASAIPSADKEPNMLPRDSGYRGLWYMNQPVQGPYGYKYSGGFATYPQQHLPIAVYSAVANKTFFCYGGRPREKNSLLHMVSYYDHATGLVPRPTILLDKHTDDAHDNPTMMIDGGGHIWIFSNAHGPDKLSYIHRSVRTLDISAFEKVRETNFSYGQPWWLEGRGFLFLHTLYRDKGRSLHWSTSADGRQWAEPKLLARIENGHYQVSWRDGNRVATAFNMHPNVGGLNFRTNLYFLQTLDGGSTWRTAGGEVVKTPLTEVKNPALVHDYQADKLLVYLKDIQFTAAGEPVVMFLTSKGWAPGPDNGPRVWYTARWTGKEWLTRRVCESDHNYDYGSLYIEGKGVSEEGVRSGKGVRNLFQDGSGIVQPSTSANAEKVPDPFSAPDPFSLWRLIAPTDPGPQPWCTGGDMVMWTSADQGLTWKRAKTLTSGGEVNHTYARRPVNAHPDFYALWADGNPLKPSGSALYFCTRDGIVRRLPAEMKKDFEEPEK